MCKGLTKPSREATVPAITYIIAEKDESNWTLHCLKIIQRFIIATIYNARTAFLSSIENESRRHLVLLILPFHPVVVTTRNSVIPPRYDRNFIAYRFAIQETSRNYESLINASSTNELSKYDREFSLRSVLGSAKTVTRYCDWISNIL